MVRKLKIQSINMSTSEKENQSCTTGTAYSGPDSKKVLAEVEKASPKLQNDFWEILDVVISLGYLKVAPGKEFEASISTYSQTIKDGHLYFSE